MMCINIISYSLILYLMILLPNSRRDRYVQSFDRVDFLHLLIIKLSVFYVIINPLLLKSTSSIDFTILNIPMDIVRNI